MSGVARSMAGAVSALPPRRLDCFDAGAAFVLIAVGVTPKPVRMERRKDELVTKTLERLRKRLGAAAPLQLHPAPAEEATNRHAWPAAASLVLPAERVPVVLDPPRLEQRVAELSTLHPRVGVPIAAECGGVPDGVDVVYEWVADGALVGTSAVFTPDRPTDALECRLTPVHTGRGLKGEALTLAAACGARPLPAALVDKHTEWKKGVRGTGGDGSFRVATYNILADQYVDEASFPYCPGEAREAAYREVAVLADVLAMGSDLLSLQEVGISCYRRLAMVLERRGYTGWHTPKASNSEGCATFYRTDRFEVLEQDAFRVGGDPADMPFPDDIGREVAAHEYTRNAFAVVTSVCQYYHLRDRSSGDDLAFVNTHLYYHPQGNHMRALQLVAVGHYLTRKGVADRVILTGDLNTVRDAWVAPLIESVSQIGVRCRPVADGAPRCLLLFTRLDDGALEVAKHAADGAGPSGSMPSPFRVDPECEALEGLAAVGRTACHALSYDVDGGVLTVNGDGYCVDMGLTSITNRYLTLFRALLLGSSVAYEDGFPSGVSPPMAARLLAGEPVGAVDRDWLHANDPVAGSPPFSMNLAPPLALADPNRDVPFTIHSPGFTHVIDWTLYSPASFALRGVMPQPHLGAVRTALPGLPSEGHPSDHVPLCVDLVHARPLQGS
eukprot:TRINITY_DN16610_c0_g1_i1.p1 TRINITY_DN16610_c0_g1~~TRINITY_DN16610_c0_g1_i1.p1  ORF type:complete len:669 (+),score=168.71 TRINITY_DN16610_c0_g1_i1:141-2147(+)